MMIKMAKDIEELKKKEPTEDKSVEETPTQLKKEVSAKVEAPKEAVALPAKSFSTAKMVMGDKAPENLSAYYVANPQTVEALSSKLKANGFEILSTYAPLKGKTVITVTNDELKKSNSFVSVLNILVNAEDEIRVQNPSYLGAAYLQDGFKYGQFKATINALEATLGQMYVAKEVTEFSELSDYNFMFGMPHFDDTITVAEGNGLVEKLTGEKADKYFAYSIKLPNGATLVGHKLNKRTNKFLGKIASEHNAGLLPYQTIIKDGKAIMLDPKYYLALSLPLLTMTEFMKIATAPDEIEKDLKRAYK